MTPPSQGGSVGALTQNASTKATSSLPAACAHHVSTRSENDALNIRIAIASHDLYVSKGRTLEEDENLREHMLSILSKFDKLVMEQRQIQHGRDDIESFKSMVDIVDWRARDCNFDHYDIIFVSSTWNAHRHACEFREWLNSHSDKLVNHATLMERCFNKKAYLDPLIRKFGESDRPEGSVIPTLFCERPEDISGRLDEAKSRGWDEVVIKPCIGADSDLVKVFYQNMTDWIAHFSYQNEDNCQPWAKASKHLEDILLPEKEPAMIQPLVRSVFSSPTDNSMMSQLPKGVFSLSDEKKGGEYQFVFFDGKLSHVAAKPKIRHFALSASEDRLPVEESELPKGMLEFAGALYRCGIAELPYDRQARVRLDLFHGNEGPLLNEVEVIEPSCNTHVFDEKIKFNILQRFAKSVLKHGVQRVFRIRRLKEADVRVAKRFRLDDTIVANIGTVELCQERFVSDFREQLHVSSSDACSKWFAMVLELRTGKILAGVFKLEVPNKDEAFLASRHVMLKKLVVPIELQNYGIASHALTKIPEVARSHFKCESIVATVNERNLASCRLFERNFNKVFDQGKPLRYLKGSIGPQFVFQKQLPS